MSSTVSAVATTSPMPASRPTKYRRLLLRAIAVFLAVLVILAMGMRLFLSSAYAARLASERLSATLGVPVRIASISPGLQSTAVRSLEIAEADNANDGKPWLVVQIVNADTSVPGMLMGNEPKTLAFRQAAITLRFDAGGKLLTRLPKQEDKAAGQLPTLRFEQSRVIIQQEGRADAAFSGISMEFREENSRLIFDGKINDQDWGRWQVAANIDASSRAGTVSLQTPGVVRVTPDLLRRIPFIPANIWDEVVLTGETSANINFEFNPNDDHFKYVVRCEPRNTDVYVSSIDLQAMKAAGSVIVEDSIVTLKNVKGSAANGQLDVEGVLNFREEPNELKLKVDARNMLVKLLPPEWGIERKVPVKGIGDGVFGGHADIIIRTGDAGTSTDGSGTAKVVVPKFVSGQDLEVDLFLRPSGKRLEFQPKEVKNTSWDQSLPIDSHRTQLVSLITLLQPPLKDDKKPEPKKKDAEKKEEPSYFDINITLRDVDLAELISKLDVTIPFKIGGRITFKVSASIPTDAPDELKNYRFDGTATLPKLTIEDLTLEDVQVKVVYRDGKLMLSDLSARLPEPGNPKVGGSFKGTASVGLIPEGDLEAHLDLDRLPVGQILGLFPDLAKGADGSFSGKLHFKAPAGQLTEPSKWSGQATLTAEKAKAVGWEMQRVNLDATLANGLLSLKHLTGMVEGTEVSASGELKLADRYPFTGKLDFKQLDLAMFNKLAPTLKPPVELAGKFETTANIKGELSPLTYQIGGKAAASNLMVKGFPIDRLDFGWDLDGDRLKVSDLHSSLLGGEISGTATIPFRPDVNGAVDLKLKQIDLAELSKRVPALGRLLRVEGKAEGTVQATIPVAKGNEPRTTTADVQLRAAKLTVRGIPAEKLRATAEYRSGQVKYKVQADGLKGGIEFDGVYPPKKGKAAPADGQQGRLTLRKIQLAGLWGPLGIKNTLDKLDGEFSLNLPFTYDEDGDPVGTGSVILEHVRWGDRTLIERLSSVARLNGNDLRFEQIDAPFASGSIRGLVIVNLGNPDRSRAILTMRNVSAAKLFFPLPELASRIDAPLDVQLRTSLGRQIRGTAVVSSVGGKLYGQRINSIRLPVEFDLVPSQQRGSVTVRDAVGELAQGRLAAQASYEYFGDAGGRLEGELKFTNVNVNSLIRTSSDLGLVGVGQATGQFDFSGRDVRSLDDVNGKLTATLGRAQLTEIPVLKEVIPFLGPSGRVADRRSEVRATLSKSVWKVEKLALVGQTLQLFADGTVTTSGRLNLNVTANTGRIGISPLALRAAGIQIPVTVGPIPVSLLLQVSRYISNRTINLEVTGTIDNPTVRIKTLNLLKEEAVRFFLESNNVPLP